MAGAAAADLLDGRDNRQVTRVGFPKADGVWSDVSQRRFGPDLLVGMWSFVGRPRVPRPCHFETDLPDMSESSPASLFS